ncbi:MAG: hypothetical protein FLDDKLPJ_02663 [Phycisphaerae bacterium]|nr:hypothetical protein [Phycisphaerae bacterium]
MSSRRSREEPAEATRKSCICRLASELKRAWADQPQRRPTRPPTRLPLARQRSPQVHRERPNLALAPASLTIPRQPPRCSVRYPGESRSSVHSPKDARGSTAAPGDSVPSQNYRTSPSRDREGADPHPRRSEPLPEGRGSVGYEALFLRHYTRRSRPATSLRRCHATVARRAVVELGLALAAWRDSRLYRTGLCGGNVILPAELERKKRARDRNSRFPRPRECVQAC